MFITIIIFVVVLSILVFVHEMGHFFTAKKMGAKVEEFGFGLPPRAVGVYKKDGKWKWVGKKTAKEEAFDTTIYSINWLPIGGFVQIKGENGEGVEESDSFACKPIWQRAIMLSAGVLMNIVLCMVLLIIIFMAGSPTAINDNMADSAVISNAQVRIWSVIDDAPAQAAGMEAGDVVVKINDQDISRRVEMQELLDDKEGETVVIAIDRDGKELVLDVGVVAYQDIVGIGVSVMETATVRYPWYLAIWQGIKTTFIWLAAIITAFVLIIKNLIIGAPIGVEVAGPVGIAVMTGQAAQMGWVYIMQFTALLSINLAIVNILPVPALDGGRLVFLLVEKIRGKPASQKWEAMAHNTGFMLLMLLVLFVTYKDIVRYGGEFLKRIGSLVGL
jgi:regulator of sigma E protease